MSESIHPSRDALEARIAELEVELRAAEQRIYELELQSTIHVAHELPFLTGGDTPASGNPL